MSSNDYIKNIRSKIGSSTLMIPSVAAVIFNDNNEIILQEKSNEPWSLPAGMIDPGESPRDAIIREVREETGLMVKPTKVLGVFGGKEFSYTYPNGHQVEYTIILMLCEKVSEETSSEPLDSETVSLKYYSKESMPPLALPYPLDVLFNEVSDSLIK
ncbi:MAG: NUDIX domain-containing protein [Alteromonadales bacterium]|nr:NUDIX domain-containing protein [Alteromonadales bacterium]